MKRKRINQCILYLYNIKKIIKTSMSNAKEILEKIKKVFLEKDEPVVTPEESNTTVSIDEKISELESRMIMIEKILNENEINLKKKEEEIKEKEVKIEELSSQIIKKDEEIEKLKIELSTTPVSEPITIEKTKKESFASYMIGQIEKKRREKGLDY